jgi:hypothetical protein
MISGGISAIPPFTDIAYFDIRIGLEQVQIVMSAIVDGIDQSIHSY